MPVSVATRGLSGRPAVGCETVRRRAEAMLEALGVGEAELSVLLCDDETIRALNRTYRGIDRATDVLSFSLEEPPGGAGPRLLGDVVVSLETAARQAPGLERGLREEVTRLLAHGLLHLVGRDHATARELRSMERETDRLASAAATARRRIAG